MDDATDPNLAGLPPEAVRQILAGRQLMAFDQRHTHTARPWSEAEATLVAELDALPIVRVEAGDDADLRARGFERARCHHNCIAASSAGEGEHVLGWIASRDLYVLHSVLRLAEGRLVCITPESTDELDAEGRFQFKIDPDVRLEGLALVRRGAVMNEPSGVVRRSAEVQAWYDDLRDRVFAGDLTADEADRLIEAGHTRMPGVGPE